MPSEYEKAYAAGVMDSDGSFGVYQSGSSMKAVCTVSVLDPRLPAMLQGYWGGSVTMQRDKRLEEPRPMYRWQLGGMKSATFVRDVLPYLVSKPEQALLYIKLCGTMTRGGCKVSEETRQQRREWMEELSRLKWV